MSENLNDNIYRDPERMFGDLKKKTPKESLEMMQILQESTVTLKNIQEFSTNVFKH